MLFSAWGFSLYMQDKIKELEKKFESFERELQNPDIFNDQKKASKISKEYNEIGQTLEDYKKLKEINKNLEELKKTVDLESDKELKELMSDEINELSKKQSELNQKIEEALNPADPLDKRNIIIEIRAGTGGDEAALFAANLFRMYSRYAEEQGWQTKLINSNSTEIGGYKEVVFGIEGISVYSKLKYESGTHRVQRVPDTEKSGRRAFAIDPRRKGAPASRGWHFCIRGCRTAGPPRTEIRGWTDRRPRRV